MILTGCSTTMSLWQPMLNLLGWRIFHECCFQIYFKQKKYKLINNILSVVVYDFLSSFNKFFNSLAIEISQACLKEYIQPSPQLYIIIEWYTVQSVRNWWISDGTKSGEYGGWGSTSHLSSWITALVMWGQALSYCIRMPFYLFVLFAELLCWLCAVVECRASPWVFGCTQSVHNELYFPSPTIHTT